MLLLAHGGWDRVWGHTMQQIDSRRKQSPNAPQHCTAHIKVHSQPGSQPGPQLRPRHWTYHRETGRKLGSDSYCFSPFQLRKSFLNFRALCIHVPTAFYLLVMLPTAPATNTPPNTFRADKIAQRCCKLIHSFKLNS